MSKRDGGGAFPRPKFWPTDGDPDSSGVPQGGMSLRDYFAANSGFTVQLHIFTGSDGQMEMLDPHSLSDDAQQRIADFKAQMSYRLADAMLAERAK